MFCKWCGKKIIDNSVPCPHCGRDQGPLESGNGFWDLNVNGKNERKSEPKLYPERNDVSSRPLVRENKKIYQLLPLALSALSLLLTLIMIIVSFINSARVSNCLNEISELKENAAETSKTYSYEKEELQTYLDSEFNKINSVINNDVPDKTQDDAPDIEITDDLKKTNKVLIKRFEANSDLEQWVYIASGSIDFDGSRSCWQKRAAADEDWETIAKGTNYIIEDETDQDYRFVFSRDKETILQFDESANDSKPWKTLSIKVTQEQLGDEYRLYSIENPDDYRFEWQISKDGSTWKKAGQDSAFLHDQSSYEYCRLVVHTDELLYAEYIAKHDNVSVEHHQEPQTDQEDKETGGF